MPEEAAAQETGTDEFAGIDPDALANILSGEAEDIPVADDQQTEEGNETGSESTPSMPLTAESIGEIIEKSIERGVQAAGNQSPAQPQQGTEDFFDTYRNKLKESYMGPGYGLEQEGAEFMANAVVEGMKPLVGEIAKAFQAQAAKTDNVQAGSALDKLDAQLNSWLDGKGITDSGDRVDIMDLTKMRAAQVSNPTSDTVRIEFEKAATSRLRNQAPDDPEPNNDDIPPVPKGNRIGFPDVVAKIRNSTDPKDDIGGERFSAAVTRMIASGMSGGGQ